MNIVEYFDPYNIHHVQAYEIMRETRQWPEGFADHLDDPPPSTWYTDLICKLANAYLKVFKKMHGRGNDQDPPDPPVQGELWKHPSL